MLVVVGVGSRVLIADAPIADRIIMPPACTRAAEDYWKANQGDYEGFERALRCYESSVKAHPRFPAIVARAQWLIDALPDER